MLVGDGERDRVTALLRDQYVKGRLTLEELTERTQRALTARSSHELGRTMTGLPVVPDVVRESRTFVRTAARGAAVVAFTGVYLLFCLALLIVFALTVLIHGASAGELAAFLVIWLVPTYALSRLWRR